MTLSRIAELDRAARKIEKREVRAAKRDQRRQETRGATEARRQPPIPAGIAHAIGADR